MKNKKIIASILLLFIYCYSSQVLSDEKVLIILASDNVQPLNVETITNLYSFRQKFMPNTQKAKLTYLPFSSEDTIQFTQKMFNYYPYQLKRIWDQAVFSGKAHSPRQFKQKSDLLHFIKTNENVIGYSLISSSDLIEIKEKYNVITTIN